MRQRILSSISGEQGAITAWVTMNGHCPTLHEDSHKSKRSWNFGTAPANHRARTGQNGLSSQNGADGSSTISSTSQTQNKPGSSGKTSSRLGAIGSAWHKAKACDQNEQYEQALYYYKLIFTLDPGTDVSRGSYRGMGLDYLKLHNYKTALQMFNEAIKLGAVDAEIHRQRGDAYYWLGQYQQSIDDFNTAIRTKPRADYYRDRSKAYRALGRADLAAADEQTASAMGLKP